MKIKFLLLTVILVSALFPAQEIKEYRFGEPFIISLPKNYVKSYDLNDVAVAQFTNAFQEKYFVIIATEREHFEAVKVSFSNIAEAGEYYLNSLKNGLLDDQTLKIIKVQNVKDHNYPAADLTVEGTLYDAETQLSVQLFYHLTVVETPTSYYQLLSWCNLKDKNKNIDEFRKIAKSFKLSK